MRFSRLLVVLLGLSLLPFTSAVSAASVDRPAWTAGDFWRYQTNTTLTPGLNLTGEATSTVAGLQPLPLGPNSVDAWRVGLSGAGTAVGIVRTGSGDVSVHGSWIVTGEEWFEPRNLHPVYSLLDVSVNGTYQSVVPFSIRVQNTTAFSILVDGWKYPLTVGSSGSLTTSINFTQDFYASTGTTVHQNGTTQWTLAFSIGAGRSMATSAGTFDAYPIDERWPDGSSQRSWYSPQIGNDLRTETDDAKGNLTAMTVLVAYRYQTLETPTFLGLTVVQWAIVAPVAAAAATASIILLWRFRRRKNQRPPEGQAPPTPTSGPRDP